MAPADDRNDPDVPLEAPKDDDKPAVPPSTRDIADTDTTVADEDKGAPAED